jgi:hypothetical protein
LPAAVYFTASEPTERTNISRVTVGDKRVQLLAVARRDKVKEPDAKLPLPRWSHSRGYVTTPEELEIITQKAARGLQPYADAVLAVENYANTESAKVRKFSANPMFWPYGTISGEQTCNGTHTPHFIGDGSPLIEAKAMVYHLRHDARYAADVRAHLLDLTGTYGYTDPDEYSGNGCVLNLSWYLPGWIIAADLIEDYPGWTPADKNQFQTWLANEIYKKVDWASDTRSNNWGAAGSATAAMIADYTAGTSIMLVDRKGAAITPNDAYLKHKQRQLDRMNGNSYMDHKPDCPGRQLVGFRPDGGIPWELARGTAGCDGQWALTTDRSWTYMQTHLEGTIMHAELLLRRGDLAIYENIAPSGAGSLHRALLFLIHNPNDAHRRFEWHHGHKPTLEFAYRYYRDPYLADELRVGQSDRFIGGRSGQMLHFGTITHGFAPNENPGSPPTVAPP